MLRGDLSSSLSSSAVPFILLCKVGSAEERLWVIARTLHLGAWPLPLELERCSDRTPKGFTQPLTNCSFTKCVCGGGGGTC